MRFFCVKTLSLLTLTFVFDVSLANNKCDVKQAALNCSPADPRGQLIDIEKAFAPISDGQSLPQAEIATTGFVNENDIIPMKESNKKFSLDPAKNLVIDIDSSKKHQEMWGFGASATESCLHNLDAMKPDKRRKLLEKMFSPEGANLNYVRLPVGANDFSLDDYTPGDTPGNKPDPQLKHFNFDRERKYARFIREVKSINPNIKVMMSPWTPPAWMKEPAHLRGGQLKKEHFGTYADYIVRTLEEYKKEGVDMHQMTIMNEPLIGDAVENWYFPQGYMSVEDQRDFIADHLGPKLMAMEKRSAAPAPKILLHDHNWDNSGGGADMFKDPKVRKVSSGIGYHCYGGELTDMQATMAQAPGAVAFQTECTSTMGNDDHDGFNWWLYHQSVDAVRMGSSGSLAWNLCLDENSGPKNDGCKSCRGLVTVDRSKNNEITYHNEFHALAHTSKYLKPGAVRIDSTQNRERGLSTVAFLNPDQSKVLVMRNDKYQDLVISVRNEKCQTMSYKIPARGAVSMRWKE